VVAARVERRLAAVLAADVAGYSRLMGADDVGTLESVAERIRGLLREGDLPARPWRRRVRRARCGPHCGRSDGLRAANDRDHRCALRHRFRNIGSHRRERRHRDVARAWEPPGRPTAGRRRRPLSGQVRRPVAVPGRVRRRLGKAEPPPLAQCPRTCSPKRCGVAARRRHSLLHCARIVCGAKMERFGRPIGLHFGVAGTGRVRSAARQRRTYRHSHEGATRANLPHHATMHPIDTEPCSAATWWPRRSHSTQERC